MVLRNGRPNDILSVSRDARANSTSQSTALFPTVILAGRATLAICIGKPFWRDAACIVPRRMQPMHACMHAMHVRMRPRAPTISVRCVSRGRKTAGGDEGRCEINIRPRSGCLRLARLARREVTWQFFFFFFCHDRSYYSRLIRSPRLHRSLAGQIKRA